MIYSKSLLSSSICGFHTLYFSIFFYFILLVSTVQLYGIFTLIVFYFGWNIMFLKFLDWRRISDLNELLFKSSFHDGYKLSKQPKKVYVILVDHFNRRISCEYVSYSDYVTLFYSKDSPLCLAFTLGYYLDKKRPLDSEGRKQFRKSFNLYSKDLYRYFRFYDSNSLYRFYSSIRLLFFIKTVVNVDFTWSIRSFNIHCLFPDYELYDSDLLYDWFQLLNIRN